MHQSNPGAASRIKSATLALLAAALAACGGGGGGSPTPVPPAPVNGPAWLAFGRDAQHSGVSGVATQNLNRIVWQAPVDLAPQYSPQGYLLVHYGSPVITANNTVVVPVKRAVQELYKVEARSGANGALVWTMDSDYVMPPNNWTPSYNVTLTAGNRVVAPGAGGKVYYRDDADAATATIQTAVFYGDAVYMANQAALDTAVIINTPISADAQGNLFFGFIAAAGNAAQLSSGIARLGTDGKGSWVSAATASANPATFKMATSRCWKWSTARTMRAAGCCISTPAWRRRRSPVPSAGTTRRRWCRPRWCPATPAAPATSS